VTLEEEMLRAGEARQVLESTVFQAAIKDIEEQMAAARRSVPIRDTEMHTRIILMGQLWDNLVGYLQRLADTGRFAQLELEKRAKWRQAMEAGLQTFRAGGRNRI
jgi:hypothetical protein